MSMAASTIGSVCVIQLFRQSLCFTEETLHSQVRTSPQALAHASAQWEATPGPRSLPLALIPKALSIPIPIVALM